MSAIRQHCNGSVTNPLLHIRAGWARVTKAAGLALARKPLFFRSTAPSLPLGLNPRAFRLPCMVTTEMEYEWVSINVRYSVFGVVFLDFETTYFANRTNAAVASFHVGISHHRQPALP
jgi:hypothetical protein